MSTVGKVLLVIGWGVAFQGELRLAPNARAQAASSSATARPDSGSSALTLQRSVKIFNYKTTAERGPLRGEEIYYYKCWMCHNSYTIKMGTGAVPLKDIFKRPRLTSGQPVNDQTVSEKIKNGGPAMPAFRNTLNDADIADVLSYLRDEKCCFEGLEPPRNPGYRY